MKTRCAGGEETRYRRRARRRTVGAWGALALVGVWGGCTGERVTSSRSSSILMVDRIETGGRGEGGPSTVLQSDVVVDGQVRDDVATVTTRLLLKDPGGPTNPTAPTSANVVTVERYQVEYLRSDGRNEPGVDVPFPFEGGVTFSTNASLDTAEFIVVRATAKLEAPLRALAEGGGAIVINTTARVTFFGYDQTGASVQGIGHIGVHFSDWADPVTADRSASAAGANR